MFESEFLTSAPESKERYIELLSKVVELIVSNLPDRPYCGKNQDELASLLTSDLPLGSDSTEQILDRLQLAISHSINVNHPSTIAHLHCPPLLASLAAEIVISTLNQSMDSFDQAPFATVLEQELITWLCCEVGFSENSGGTLTAGGTQSNYQALLLARDRFVESQWHCSVQKSGMPPQASHMRVLCSEVAHFTIEKSMAQLGLGLQSVVRVKTDELFRMNPVDLRQALESLRNQELMPFAIVATAGSTDFGSIDPLMEIAQIAQSDGVWLHIDAAYGGALLFSTAQRPKLKGIEVADSVSLDFHKLLWQPIPCGVFLLRNRNYFESMRFHAEYLNPENSEQKGIPNLVTNSLLTTRRFDALKVWTALHALGQNKLGSMIDRTLYLAKQAADLLRMSPRFQLEHEPEMGTVVFRYRPEDDSLDPNELNRELSQLLFRAGVAVIGHTEVHGRQALKFTCMNPTIRANDLEALIGTIMDFGRQLERSKRHQL